LLIFKLFKRLQGKIQILYLIIIKSNKTFLNIIFWSLTASIQEKAIFWMLLRVFHLDQASCQLMLFLSSDQISNQD